MEVIRGHLGCPLSGGRPLFGGSAIGGSTVLLIARTARIACSDRHTDTHTYTHIHTHTRDNYCNPLCACAPRVNYSIDSIPYGTVGYTIYVTTMRNVIHNSAMLLLVDVDP